MRRLKRLFLVLPIVAVLVAALCVPATASARTTPRYATLNSSGMLVSIDEGNTWQTRLGYWIVLDRHVEGLFTQGDLAPRGFSLTYNGLIKSAETQVGVIHGDMVIDGGLQGKITGVTGITGFVDIGGGTYLPKLSFGGTWSFTGGAKGAGTFSGYFVFVPYYDDAGNPHVGYILPDLSMITVKGRWIPQSD